MRLIFGFQRSRFLLGRVGIGVHRVDLVLAVVDHLFDRLKQKMFQHGKGDQHIAKGKQRCPRIDAYKAFKACHLLSLLS